MYYNWQPDEDSGFTGHIKLRLPTFYEKFEYLEKCGLNVDEHGEVKTKGNDMIKATVTMVKMSEPHYEEVSLEKADGSKYDSFESMQYDPDCHQIYMQIAGQLLSGLQPGNG